VEALSGENREALDAFLEMLDYLEDVQNVYHNVS
jgi:transcriptional/translational regulatory protein YebC/TACO1